MNRLSWCEARNVAAENTDTILTGGLSTHDFEEFQRMCVDDLQMRLARLSTRGGRIMVQGSGHDVPSDRPESIVNAVNELCAAATARHYLPIRTGRVRTRQPHTSLQKQMFLGT